MAADDIKKVTWYLKDTQDIAMFSSMVDSRLMLALRASPLFYIMLPFIGFLLTVIAGMNAYTLYKSSNKNLDLWLDFISSSLSAGFASVSLYGTALSVIMGFTYPAGPWFFVGSLLVGLVHQAAMMGINFSRTFSAPKDSIQRTHHLQAALKNIYIITALSAALSTAVFVMLLPAIAPMAGVVSAVSTVALIFLGIQWRVFPSNWKRSIKNFFHAGKPELIQNIELGNVTNLNDQSLDTAPEHHNPLFHIDYSESVRKMDVTTAKSYLHRLITQKIESYRDVSLDDQKLMNKRNLLEHVLDVLEDPSITCSERDLLKAYPKAFQSALKEKGGVKQLFDAAMVYLEKYQAYQDAEVQRLNVPGM